MDNEKLFQRVREPERYNDCRLEAEELDEDELWEITNGHDICIYLGQLSGTGKKNTLGEVGVRDALLVSYREDDFSQTTLYQNILHYQQQRQLKFLEDNIN